MFEFNIVLKFKTATHEWQRHSNPPLQQGELSAASALQAAAALAPTLEQLKCRYTCRNVYVCTGEIRINLGLEA